MEIKNNHIKEFEKALKADGIELASFEDLHEVCDPNAYAYDVLKIEIDSDTIEIYNQFSDKWNEYVAR